MFQVMTAAISMPLYQQEYDKIINDTSCSIFIHSFLQYKYFAFTG